MKVWYKDSMECGSHSRDWQMIRNSIPDFELVNSAENADVAILYLCGLSNKAIDGAEREIEKVGSTLSKNPNLKVFIGGCAVDLISVQTLLGKYGLTNTFGKNTMAEVVLEGLGLKPSEKTTALVSHDKVTVSISVGCCRRCSFCKSWYLDMEYRSTPKDVIMSEIGYAVSHGVLHVCLTAENSTEYGSDIEKDGRGHLEELLREIFQTYPEIKIMDVMGVCLDEVDDGLVEYFLEEKRINEIQMEVQSFIQEVRKEMLLKKSAEEAKTVYAKLRSRKIVRSNIITGHYGETSANFNSQLKYILANEENCWSLDISPLDNTPSTHSYELERVEKSVAEANKGELIRAIMKMRKAWATKALEPGNSFCAYAVTHKGNRTLCMVWGQPVIITVEGHLPLYKSVTVRPKRLICLSDDNGNIWMDGAITIL